MSTSCDIALPRAEFDVHHSLEEAQQQRACEDPTVRTRPVRHSTVSLRLFFLTILENVIVARRSFKAARHHIVKRDSGRPRDT